MADPYNSFQPRNPTIAEQLKELTDLLAAGGISQDDYNFMKKQIMGKQDTPTKSKVDKLEEKEQEIKRYLKLGGRYLLYAGAVILIVILLGKGACSSCSGPSREQKESARQEQVQQQKEEIQQQKEEAQKQKKQKVIELNGGTEKVKEKTDKFPKLMELKKENKKAFEQRVIKMSAEERQLLLQWEKENGYR
ncbi:MAG: hypothetical protein LBK26_02710 [Rickettsiales bacterium]|jgi:hypothetical protein|nr:hypothetical protein [Rickettsiales bacterium]